MGFDELFFFLIVFFFLKCDLQVANGHAVSHVSFRDSSRENIILRQTSVPAASSDVTSAGNSTVAPLATGNGTAPDLTNYFF